MAKSGKGKKEKRLCQGKVDARAWFIYFIIHSIAFSCDYRRVWEFLRGVSLNM